MTRISTREVQADLDQGSISFYTGGTKRGGFDLAGNMTAANLSVSGTQAVQGAVSIGAATDTVGFFGATAVAVQSSTATTGTFTAGGATAATSASRFTGNVGTKAYSVTDIVTALKNYGLLAS